MSSRGSASTPGPPSGDASGRSTPSSSAAAAAAADNAAATGFVDQEPLPPIFHDLASEIMPDAHQQLEDIVEFLERSTVELLQKVESIPKEHSEAESPKNTQQAAVAPEAVRLRRAIQALACVCRDSRRDLVEVSSKLDEAMEEYSHALGTLEDDLATERDRRAQQMARLQKKLEAARGGGGGGGGGDSSAAAGGGGAAGTSQEDADTIADLTEELNLVRKQLAAEKANRQQEMMDRGEDVRRARTAAEASFQANTESLRSQVAALRQQLDDRRHDDSTRGQSVNDMALVIARMSTDLHEERKLRDTLEQQVRILTEEKSSAPPPSREASLLEAEIQRLQASLSETSERHEATIATLQQRLDETEKSLSAQLTSATEGKDKAVAALSEAQAAREQTRKNVDTIRTEYNSMLDGERRQLSTELDLAQGEALSLKRSLEVDRAALRTAETRVFELSLQEERLTMELNALKVRLLHSETEAESVQRRLQRQQQNSGAAGRSDSEHVETGGLSSSPGAAAASSSSSTVTAAAAATKDNNNAASRSLQQQQQPQQQQQYSSLDAKELLRQLEGANLRNTELQRALTETEKRFHGATLQLESSKHAHRFELDEAERRASEARKNLTHSEKQHQAMIIALSPERRAEAVLQNSTATQVTDAELSELRIDLAEAQSTIDELRQQLDTAYEHGRVQCDNLEKRLTARVKDSETIIASLTDQLRAARYKANKVQTKLATMEEEHTQMSTEYNTISEALQKADSQFRESERSRVDLNMENTSLRNKLNQNQRDVEDLRRAMQVREREMELEYAEQLRKLRAEVVAAAAANGNAVVDTASNSSSSGNGAALGQKAKKSGGMGAPAAAASAMFQQLSPSPVATATIAGRNSAQERIRQLDEMIMEIHGDSLALDKKERVTRDQHVNASSKLQRDLNDLLERMNHNNANNLGAERQIQTALDEKRAEIQRLNDALGKFLSELQTKRAKLAQDQATVMAEREKMNSAVAAAAAAAAPLSDNNTPRYDAAFDSPTY